MEVIHALMHLYRCAVDTLHLLPGDPPHRIRAVRVFPEKVQP
jgi:hypothetical protein